MFLGVTYNIPFSNIADFFVPLASAGTAVAVVALTHHFTRKRDSERYAAETQQQRRDRECEITANLLTAMYLWKSSVLHRFDVFKKLHEDPKFDYDREQFRKYLRDSETFSSSLALARVSIRNPQTRPIIDMLRNLHKPVSDMVNETHEKGASEQSQALLDRLDRELEIANENLEKAALSWDGALAT